MKAARTCLLCRPPWPTGGLAYVFFFSWAPTQRLKPLGRCPFIPTRTLAALTSIPCRLSFIEINPPFYYFWSRLRPSLTPYQIAASPGQKPCLDSLRELEVAYLSLLHLRVSLNFPALPPGLYTGCRDFALPAGLLKVRGFSFACNISLVFKKV